MKSLVNLKVDSDVKILSQQLASELGLSLSAIINAFLRQFVRQKSVSFSLTPAMNPELEKLLGPIEHDIKNRKRLSPSIESPSDLEKFFDLL